MKIVGAIGAGWNVFRRGANARALAMDADPLAEIYSRVRKPEVEVFGPAANAGSNAELAGSHPKEISA